MLAMIKKIFSCVVSVDGNDDDQVYTLRVLNLNSEADRLRTFAKWRNAFVDKTRLAKTGFYYVGPNDEVCCQFCGVELKDWVEWDDEVREHLKYSPQCPLFGGDETANIILDKTSHLNYLLRLDICECPAYHDWK